MIYGAKMAKEHWTFEHPADLGLEARADSLAELFEALGEGLTEQICPRGAVRPARGASVEAEAEDLEALLVEFLSALLRLFDLQRFLVRRVRVRRIDDNSVSAEAFGEDYDPSRHELGTEVKAVTYHQLRVGREGSQWTGRVLLDV